MEQYLKKFLKTKPEQAKKIKETLENGQLASETKLDLDDENPPEIEKTYIVSNSYSKTLQTNIDNNSSELSIHIEAAQLLSIRVQHSFHPLLQWNYTTDYDQLIKEFPKLSSCENLTQVYNLLYELIENDDCYFEENGENLVLGLDLKLFKTKLKFNLVLNDVKDPEAMLQQISQLIIKTSLNIPRPFYQNSDIIKEDEMETIGYQINPQKKIKLTLLYSGKEHGFTSNVFHRKCDGKAPTLMLAKSHLGLTFGAFTKIPWDSSEHHKNDKNAFLFSLTNKFTFDRKNGSGFDVYCMPNKGPTFGPGPDLHFADKCSENFDSFSKLKYSDQESSAIEKLSGNPHSREFLAGDEYFKIKAFEVYHVQLI